MRRRRPAQDLRLAIDCLPLETRRAMLDGMGQSRIIVGAYVDRDGGVCPMLAAHRNGGRTSLASFARAWDRYTRAGKGPRPATERELRTLGSMLEASISLDDGTVELIKSAARRREVRERVNPPRDTGERDRTDELKTRHGWAWLRPFRRYDSYELALQELERIEQDRRRGRGGRQPERELEKV